MRKYISSVCLWVRTNWPVWGSVFVLLGIDRITKRLTLVYLPGKDVEIWPYLHLNYVQNTGAAFGMMQGGNMLLIVITLCILGYLLKNWQEFCSGGSVVKWALVLILGGALGNLYDRITLGFVVDFIDLRVWPVFNAADSFITVGGCMLAWVLLMPNRSAGKENK